MVVAPTTAHPYPYVHARWRARSCARMRVVRGLSATVLCLVLLVLVPVRPAAAALVIDTSGCPAGNLQQQSLLAPSSPITAACSVGFGESTGTAQLRVYRQDPTASSAMAGVPDYQPGVADWGAGRNAFGACLNSANASATPTWTADTTAGCTATNTDPWRSIPASSASGAVADSAWLATNATVDLRFGTHNSSLSAGSYSAPITIEVITTSINSAPTTPTPQAPSSGALVTSTTPTLQASFADPDGADTGRLNFRLDTTAACDATPIQSGTSSSTTLAPGATGSWTVGTPLTPGTTYYWCVEGEDASGSHSAAWTVSRSFTVNGPPTAATLVSPADGSFAVTTTPRLDAVFNDADPGDSGQLNFRLDTTDACDATPVQSGTSSVTTLANGATGTWSPTALTPGTAYYWCVQGQDANGVTGPWSMSRAVAVKAAPSLIWATGFEPGAASANGGGLSAGTNGLGQNVAGGRNGARSLRFDTTGTPGNGWYSSKLLPAGTKVLVQRYAVKVTAAPSRDIAITEVCDSGPVCSGEVVLRTDMTIDFCWQDGHAVCTGIPSTTLALGSWHLIETRFDMTTPTAWTAALRVDGVAQATPPTYNGGAAYVPATIDMGMNDGANVVGAYAFDDWAISTTAADYPLGDGRVLGYVPSGTGAHTNPASFGFSTNGGGAFTALGAGDVSASPGSAAYLDEWPAALDANLVRQTSTSGTLRYEVADTTEVNSPNGVSVVGAHREAAAGSNDVLVGAESRGAPLAGYTANPGNGTTAGYYWSGMLARPGGWMAKELNDLVLTLGSSTVTVAPWTDALMVEADFPVSTAPTATPVSPSAGRTVGTNPTLVATFTDPDFGQTGQVRFELCTVSVLPAQTCTQAGGTPVWAGASAAGLAPGSNGSWVVPTLTVGQTYHWRARAVDSLGVSGPWSATRSFTTAGVTVIGRTTAGVTAAAITVTVPAGTQAGDVMVAQLAHDTNTVTITPPAGWVSVGSIANATSGTRLDAYVRVVTGTEPVSYTWAYSGSADIAAAIATFTSVDTAAPVQVAATASGAAALSAVAPSVTPVVGNSALLTLYAADNAANGTPPGGMVEQWDTSPTPASIGIIANLQTGLPASATGTRTETLSASVAWGAISLALRPQP
ncbi:MAG: putative mannose-sensitive agglutinin biosis protein MshQ [Thermoleophilia bacterium]|nr:putative mannose-sensitive agglutinin biosis protein MshQ [Thermoleophilia bacterium]